MKLVAAARDAEPAATTSADPDLEAAADAAAQAAFAARPDFSLVSAGDDGSKSGANGNWSAVHENASVALEKSHPATWYAHCTYLQPRPPVQ